MNNKVQNEVGHEAYGGYMALFALGFLFLAFSDLGLNQFMTKSLAGEPLKLRGLMPVFFGLKLSLGIIYPFFMVGVGSVLGYRGGDLTFLLIICGTHSIAQIIAFFRSGFQAFQQFKVDAFASVLDRIFLIAIVAILLSRHITIDSYVFAGFISAAASMVLLWLFLVKQIGMFIPGKGEISWANLLKKSLPFAILTVLYSVNDKIDQVMLERMYSRHEAGLYAAAYRWVDAIMMYLWTVLPIFFARFAFHIQSNNQQKKLLRFGQGIAALPMIFCAVFAFVYGEKLLWQFKDSTPDELITMTLCLRILFIAVMVNGIFAIYSTLLTSTNSEKFVGFAIFGSIVLNVSLNIILIPEFGAIACAWDTVIAFSALSLSYIIYLSIRRKGSIPWDILIRIGIGTGIFAGAFVLLSRTTLEWYVVTVVAGSILVILSVALKIIRIEKT